MLEKAREFDVTVRFHVKGSGDDEGARFYVEGALRIFERQMDNHTSVTWRTESVVPHK